MKSSGSCRRRNRRAELSNAGNCNFPNYWIRARIWRARVGLPPIPPGGTTATPSFLTSSVYRTLKQSADGVAPKREEHRTRPPSQADLRPPRDQELQGLTGQRPQYRKVETLHSPGYL